MQAFQHAASPAPAVRSVIRDFLDCTALQDRMVLPADLVPPLTLPVFLSGSSSLHRASLAHKDLEACLVILDFLEILEIQELPVDLVSNLNATK